MSENAAASGRYIARYAHPRRRGREEGGEGAPRRPRGASLRRRRGGDRRGRLLLVGQETYDLVLLDLMLPKRGDGHRLRRQEAQLSRLRPLRVSRRQDPEEGRLLGITCSSGTASDCGGRTSKKRRAGKAPALVLLTVNYDGMGTSRSSHPGTLSPQRSVFDSISMVSFRNLSSIC